MLARERSWLKERPELEGTEGGELGRFQGVILGYKDPRMTPLAARKNPKSSSNATNASLTPLIPF